MGSSEARTRRGTAAKRAMTRAAAARDPTARTATAGGPPTALVLDRYRLQRRLGAGAFGTVWMARDERLEREVAVKVLDRARVMGGRFEREARAAARLAHPAIVTLYEAAVDDESAYLVSELVRGRTLDALLADGHLSDRDIVKVGIALCEALEHAHAQGVVHRDVKPSNVLVPDAPPSAAQVAKLTDFGVARVLGGDSLTLTGDVLGTLAYMAPEQAEGLETGAPADLYSLALVIYEALSGVNPVAQAGRRPAGRRLGVYLPPLRRQRRDLPRVLGQAVDLALRPRPRERGTVSELRRALAAALPAVADEPGVVTAPWTGGLGLRTEDPEAPADDSLWRNDAPVSRAEARDTGDSPDAGAPPIVWPARGLAAAGAAGLTVWLASHALAPSPVPAPLAGLAAAAVVLVLPRLGWTALTLAVAGTAVAEHHPGTACLLGLALVLPMVLLALRPTAWPLAAGAPALGLVGLAGAWPALAARARHPLARAALAAAGWVWLVLATALTHLTLYLPPVSGTPPSGRWQGSASVTVAHLLPALARSGVLAPALVWAAAALVLPWLVRRRSPALDLLRVVVWTAVTASAVPGAIAAVHGSAPARTAPGAAAGAVAAAVIALAPTAATIITRALHSGRSRARVS